MNEPTEQDQHELQTRLDMREAAEDALRMYAEARYATSSRMASAVLAKHVLTLLDEDEQVCMVASELARFSFRSATSCTGSADQKRSYAFLDMTAR